MPNTAANGGIWTVIIIIIMFSSPNISVKSFHRFLVFTITQIYPAVFVYLHLKFTLLFPLQGRCDINIRNNRNQTPLQLAVTQGHTDIVQLLVDEGADVNMEDEDGDTAMHVALLRPQLANIMLSPAVGTSSTEESNEGCSTTSLYCRVRARTENWLILLM